MQYNYMADCLANAFLDGAKTQKSRFAPMCPTDWLLRAT